MSPSNEEAMFALALAKPSAKRAAWLDAECQEDPALHQGLEALKTEPVRQALAMVDHPNFLKAC